MHNLKWTLKICYKKGRSFHKLKWSRVEKTKITKLKNVRLERPGSSKRMSKKSNFYKLSCRLVDIKDIYKI